MDDRAHFVGYWQTQEGRRGIFFIFGEGRELAKGSLKYAQIYDELGHAKINTGTFDGNEIDFYKQYLGFACSKEAQKEQIHYRGRNNGKGIYEGEWENMQDKGTFVIERNPNSVTLDFLCEQIFEKCRRFSPK